MIQVLKGLKVVEQGTFITGPAAGMLLGDLGADVIKVELPGTGDPFRAFQGGLYSPHFQTYNRNKRSIELNTQRADDLRVFDALIAEADVYIQNFRPGVADKLGAGEARLRALNPKLIYCSISGFGATGPAASRPAYDTVAQAASGFLNLLVNPKNPRVVGPAIADALTGYYATYGVLGALFERGRTGRGPTGRGVDAGGDGALQPRRLHPLLPGRRGDGPVQPAERVAVLRAAVRRRQMDRAAHVLAGEVLAGPGHRHRAARAVPGPALRLARAAHREPGDADRAARRALQAAARATTGAPGCKAWTCRTRRCTTPARRCSTRRRCTCS